MVQKVLTQLVDDLDGTSSTDVSTVLFGLDGLAYEIDLTDDNAEHLRTSLAEYVESARRVGGRIKRGLKPNSVGAGANGEAGEIRAWALENGYDLAHRGRLPAHVVEAYKQAQTASKPAKTTPPRASTREGKAGARTKKR